MATMPSPAPTRAPWIPGAGAVALGAVAASAIGQRRPDAYVALLTAMLFAGVVVTLRRRDRPAEASALALGFVAAALPLGVAVLCAAARSLVTDRSIEGLTLGFGFLFVIPALLLVATRFGRFAGRAFTSRAGADGATSIRITAWLATLATVALLGAWSARPRLPTAAEYVGSLPVVASFGEVDRFRRTPWVDVGADGIARRVLGRTSCVFGDVESIDAIDDKYALRGLQSCGPVVVRADRAHGLVLLEDSHGVRLAVERGWPWLPVRLSSLRLAGSVRPPDAFAALALLGLAGALVALLWPRRSPLPRDLAGCHDAEALADGTLRFADETRPPSDGAPLVVGPVVAVLGTPAESFREHAGPVVLRVVPGTLAEHRFAAHVGSAAFALAFVVIASTPLLTAILYLR